MPLGQELCKGLRIQFTSGDTKGFGSDFCCSKKLVGK